uniref:Pentapeptide repeat-containing protein n=1 Tax=Tetradesmus obliquus TaxID=3088 RepID=A0A383WPB0_TETOB|eukprot:jgi/Sobl393_1/4671/SZX79298.1
MGSCGWQGGVHWCHSSVPSTGLQLCTCFGECEQFREAARGRQPPIAESAHRCDVTALDKFADTRAKFSQESAGGNMTEAIVDVRGCDFSNQDLSGKVFSAVMLQGANLANSKVVGSQFARADAKGAYLSNVDFTDANCFGTSFDGADMQGAQFENSILTGATFGKDAAGNWANLKGAHFEGALVSSSDVGRICENPTLEQDTKRYELGCKATK